MMQLRYAPRDEAHVYPGAILEIPHMWTGWPPHQVTVEEVRPDGPGAWAFGSEQHGARVRVWIPRPTPAR